jgi:hypothetical protein
MDRYAILGLSWPYTLIFHEITGVFLQLIVGFRINKKNVVHAKFLRYLNGIGFLDQLIKHGALASQRLLKFQTAHHA